MKKRSLASLLTLAFLICGTALPLAAADRPQASPAPALQAAPTATVSCPVAPASEAEQKAPPIGTGDLFAPAPVSLCKAGWCGVGFICPDGSRCAVAPGNTCGHCPLN